MVEKRSRKRLNLRMNTNILNESGQLLAKGRIQNICEDGICFIANNEFNPGIKAVFEYKMGEISKTIKIIGRIVWRRKYETIYIHGVRFEKVGFWPKLKLKRYIKMYLKRIEKPISGKIDEKKRSGI